MKFNLEKIVVAGSIVSGAVLTKTGMIYGRKPLEYIGSAVLISSIFYFFNKIGDYHK